MAVQPVVAMGRKGENRHFPAFHQHPPKPPVNKGNFHGFSLSGDHGRIGGLTVYGKFAIIMHDEKTRKAMQ
jgi:hypothetical protein